jgi:hypothetical protein
METLVFFWGETKTSKERYIRTLYKRKYYLHVPPLRLSRFSTHSISSILLGEFALTDPTLSWLVEYTSSPELGIFSNNTFLDTPALVLPLFVVVGTTAPFPDTPSTFREFDRSGGGDTGAPGGRFSLSLSTDGSW